MGGIREGRMECMEGTGGAEEGSKKQTSKQMNCKGTEGMTKASPK